jgi:hypothetical protein
LIDFEGKNKTFPYEDKAIEKRKKTQKYVKLVIAILGMQ